MPDVYAPEPRHPDYANHANADVDDDVDEGDANNVIVVIDNDAPDEDIGQRPTDNGRNPEDTSFEVDESEDDDDDEGTTIVVTARGSVKRQATIDDKPLIAIGSSSLTTTTSASSWDKSCTRTGTLVNCPKGKKGDIARRYTATQVVTTSEDDFDDDLDLSDETEDTGSSTTTAITADVADVLTTVAITPTAERCCKRLSPLQRFKSASPNNDDNLSGSIATTTTEIDLNDSINNSILPVSLNLTTTRSRVIAAAMGTSSSSSPGIAGEQLQRTTPHALLERSDANCKISMMSTNHLHHHHHHQRSRHKRTQSASSYFSIASQSMPSTTAQAGATHPAIKVNNNVCVWMLKTLCLHFKNSGIGEPSVYHALVVIFLEFFAWGLLTVPLISVLNQTFPEHTFLMNGIVMGIKGILSFLSAPLIGALSDIWGRKFFLLITVFFTCAPLPLMTINTFWFFAMISISGVFAVTFSVVFAYVADVTTSEERSRAYGLVSATFAASMVISPALGAFLLEQYGDTVVVALATAIAVLDVFFILVAVPESLPEKIRPSSWGAPISWEQADPFAALRKVGTDHTILMQCVTVLLSYLPEAGQYSCIFVYLKLKMGFNSMVVSIFIAVVGILSIGVQVTLGYLMRVLGAKRTIIVGLILEMLQMLWFGFGSESWMMWAAGILAALGSITYPAISAYVSLHSTADRQGAVQGMVTGMRGLCNGLGPAMFGVIFYLFNVDLNGNIMEHSGGSNILHNNNHTGHTEMYSALVPGPPFAFGALMVILAIMVAVFMPDVRNDIVINRTSVEKKRGSMEIEHGHHHHHKTSGPLAPLMRSDSLAQL